MNSRYELKTIKRITVQVDMEVPEGRGNSAEDIFDLLQERINKGEKFLPDAVAKELGEGWTCISKIAGWVVNGISEVEVVFEKEEEVVEG